MIQLTQRDVISHQLEVKWPDMRQVEQDLLLCRAMNALFSDDFLKSQIAMRGGTLLHKVYFSPASRYSEDVDLVIIGNKTAEEVKKAINRVLVKPHKSIWEDVKLAVRNVVRPSKVLRETFHVSSCMGGKPLEIVVEANATERISHRDIAKIQFSYQFRGQTSTATINGFEIHEMLGTKMRALFQRKRGRDLFDLYWALTESDPAVKPVEIIESFRYYMDQEGAIAGRDEFIGVLHEYLNDAGFLSDMRPLLRSDIKYDPIVAGDYIINNLLRLLPVVE